MPKKAKLLESGPPSESDVLDVARARCRDFGSGARESSQTARRLLGQTRGRRWVACPKKQCSLAQQVFIHHTISASKGIGD
jgi:hypothetical protein